MSPATAAKAVKATPNEKKVRRIFDAFNARDWNTLRGMFHPDYTYIGPDGEQLHGLEEGIAAAWMSWADGFSDARIELKDIYTDGDVVVSEVRATMTHTGTWQGIAPTGKAVEMEGCNVMRFKGGKVLFERDYLDTLPFFARLGVIEMPQLPSTSST